MFIGQTTNFNILPTASNSILKACSWNIAGLRPKLADPDWIKWIHVFDIIFLQEIWELTPTYIDGFMTFFSPAMPSPAGRPL